MLTVKSPSIFLTNLISLIKLVFPTLELESIKNLSKGKRRTVNLNGLVVII